MDKTINALFENLSAHKLMQSLNILEFHRHMCTDYYDLIKLHAFHLYWDPESHNVITIWLLSLTFTVLCRYLDNNHHIFTDFHREINFCTAVALTELKKTLSVFTAQMIWLELLMRSSLVQMCLVTPERPLVTPCGGRDPALDPYITGKSWHFPFTKDAFVNKKERYLY